MSYRVTVEFICEDRWEAGFQLSQIQYEVMKQMEAAMKSGTDQHYEFKTSQTVRTVSVTKK